MKEIIAPVLLLLLLQLVIPVTSSTDSVQLVQFDKVRKSKDGPVMCAVDLANKTKSPSSLQDCSRDCARDAICTNFNFKNFDTCDLYDYHPLIFILMSACENYKVSSVLYTVSHIVTVTILSKMYSMSYIVLYICLTSR